MEAIFRCLEHIASPQRIKDASYSSVTKSTASQQWRPYSSVSPTSSVVSIMNRPVLKPYCFGEKCPGARITSVNLGLMNFLGSSPDVSDILRIPGLPLLISKTFTIHIQQSSRRGKHSLCAFIVGSNSNLHLHTRPS